MDRAQKKTLLILGLLSIAYFLIFIPPNAAASKSIEMVTVFEPDEAVPLPYVFNMIKPAGSFKQVLINFAFYKYYFYGFPYFAYSALLLLPLQWLNRLGDISLVMVLLRQMVSVLPILASIWVLVYLQTRFRGYRAVLLFVFLLNIPAVIQNNFWWHPDGLAIFFAVLAIFFLDRDNLHFGRFFYLAAVMCGISAGIKGIGFYFFLTIIVYLLIGYFTKKATIRHLILSAFGFLACMAGSYLLVNPTLIYTSVRERYFQVMFDQSQMLSQGYEIVYAKGLLSILPQMVKDYAVPPLLIGVFGLCIWGVARGPNRLLHTILLTWALPTSFLVCFLIHYKYQYWLPVALPLFSTIAIILPEKIQIRKTLHSRKITTWIAVLLVGVLLFQASINLRDGMMLYSQQLHREENDPSFQFYDRVVEVLNPLPQDHGYHVYHDVRLYVPSKQNWNSEAIFEMLNYNYIQGRNYDILLLSLQRVYDYLDSTDVGLDVQSFAAAQTFYRDANNGEIQGYRLLYRDDFGLIFIKAALYDQYFSHPN